jgi:hypothetical protein
VSLPAPSDQSSLSAFTQLLTTLQQLQQSNPAQYQQVTQQIATNLQSAAKAATSGGDSAAASELNQLATDFTSASQTGQLPNLQDLAQAIGGAHHHHGHHHGGSAADPNSATSSLDQLINSLGANSQSSQFNAESIIFNMLSSAGAI